jgi:hypothetical protein
MLLLCLYRERWTVLAFEIDLKVSWAELGGRLWRGDALNTLGDRLRSNSTSTHLHPRLCPRLNQR